MTNKIKNGWHTEATRIDSPNFDARPEQCSDGSPCQVDTLVIHAISLPPAGADPISGCTLDGDFSGNYVEQFFCNQLDGAAHPYFAAICDTRVSAHFYIRRDGTLVQFVSTEKRAWHAGKSRFGERERVNDFSVGVELEGCDSVEFEARQYARLAALTTELISTYPAIRPQHIVGHSDIAPDRKTDPGPHFDWPRYLGNIKA